MRIGIIVAMVGLCASMSGIIFVLLALIRSEGQEHRKESKNEDLILADFGCIKVCGERAEKNLNKVEEGCQDIVERLAKTDRAISNIEKRVDTLCLNGGD